MHAPQACRALEAGSLVLCEKPAAATVQDVDLMLETSRRTGSPVAVGYQWSFTESVQALKKDIISGIYGAPRRLKSLCLWPRDAAYYGRNDWAGRLRDENGAWVLDGPANNAMAHDLHNMLYILGDEAAASARPASVTAELYRANDIESYDTAAFRVVTDAGVEVLFYGSHAIPESYGPVFTFEFSGGTISYAGGKDPIRGAPVGGNVREYAAPDTESHARKLWTCLRAASAGDRDPAALLCPLEAARAQTVSITGAHASVPEAVALPAGLIRETGDGPQRLRWVDGLEETLRRCYERALLPGEVGVKWAQTGKTVDVGGYDLRD
jgi:predicted dehydrogenase